MSENRTTRPVWLTRPVVMLAAALLPMATAGAFATARDEFASATAALVLVLWVVAAAATGDRWAGVLAAVSGGLWFDFFLTEPYQRFTISDPNDVEVTVLLVLIGLAVTEVALWGYRQQARAARRSGYLEGVFGAATAVAAGDVPASAVIDVVNRQIVQVLGVDSSRFVKGEPQDRRSAILDHDGVVTRAGRPVDVDRVGLPFDEELAIPVHLGTRIVGHFLTLSAAKMAYPTLEQRRVAVLLADQAAPVLAAP